MTYKTNQKRGLPYEITAQYSAKCIKVMKGKKFLGIILKETEEILPLNITCDPGLQSDINFSFLIFIIVLW